MTFPQLCLAFVDYCTATGASVTSWGRTRERNRKVGGAARSRHLDFTAIDVVYDVPNVDPITGVQLLTADGLELQREQLARLHGLGLIHEGDHDHVEAR